MLRWIQRSCTRRIPLLWRLQETEYKFVCERGYINTARGRRIHGLFVVYSRHSACNLHLYESLSVCEQWAEFVGETNTHNGRVFSPMIRCLYDENLMWKVVWLGTKGGQAEGVFEVSLRWQHSQVLTLCPGMGKVDRSIQADHFMKTCYST